MFYLHMAPPPATPSATGSSSGSGGSRLTTPSRPKSAAPAICVPTMQLTAPRVAGRRKVDTVMSRPAAYVGFSPRAPTAPRPMIRVGAGAMRTSFGDFQNVLQAKSPLTQPRQAAANEASKKATLEQERPTNGSPNLPTTEANSLITSTSATTANVFHAMTARKTAEENAKQLARRLAHFRAQEEKVLREVQLMKQRLENLLLEQEQSDDQAELMSQRTSPATPATRRPLSATNGSRSTPRRELSTPRSREQLQFLTKQRRVIEAKKMEEARLQKEKRQAALETQRQKEAAEQSRKEMLKERIRQERQRALDLRAAKQHQLLDVLEQQHHARLRQEQVRELAATRLVDEMKEEEKNIALRLEALRVHQDHIKRGLETSFHGSALRTSPPRPSSARTAPPRSHRVTSPRIEPFASVDADNPA